MVTVFYQVVHNKAKGLKAEIERILKGTFNDHYITYDEDNFDFVDIKYSVSITGDKYVSGFSIDLETQDYDHSKMIQSINDRFADDEGFFVAFKYSDNPLFTLLQRLYGELYNIEMKLREAITLIFIDSYKDDFYNLLYEIDVSPRPLLREVQKNKENKGKFLAKRLENEFFHILFSDYVKLTKPRTLKQNDLYLIAKLSNNFDEFRDKILKRGIVKEEYLEFINSIKENLDNLEKVRNCVAHNRTPSDDDIYNYDLSKEDVIQKIDAFIQSLSGEEEGNAEHL